MDSRHAHQQKAVFDQDKHVHIDAINCPHAFTKGPIQNPPAQAVHVYHQLMGVGRAYHLHWSSTAPVHPEVATPASDKFYRHQHCALSGLPGRVFLAGVRGGAVGETGGSLPHWIQTSMSGPIQRPSSLCQLNSQCRLKENQWQTSRLTWRGERAYMYPSPEEPLVAAWLFYASPCKCTIPGKFPASPCNISAQF